MMNLTPETRAGILVEALPYIQEYAGQIIVVKYGGNAMVSEVLKEAVIQDIVLLNLVGIKVVLVHGGGPEISEMLKKNRQRIDLCQRSALYGRGDDGYRPDDSLRQSK